MPVCKYSDGEGQACWFLTIHEEAVSVLHDTMQAPVRCVIASMDFHRTKRKIGMDSLGDVDLEIANIVGLQVQRTSVMGHGSFLINGLRMKDGAEEHLLLNGRGAYWLY
ncbi:MAG: hypothetical protein CMO30_08335 [Tistrella sp.]|uniref:Uncharacterized protein n=1 Tax=Tistrella mobilis TaxID=171437 RepID=A0A3B9IDU7_9PROT|nr:hypothetical protein [Tistrella sp.]MBA75276.1 hypothetical protein [Tistrella sp.]HAE46061.1 hypothetical protein [Tistrella mobilis]